MNIETVSKFLDASNDWPGWTWAAVLAFGICFLWSKLPAKICPQGALWLASCAAGVFANLYLAAPAPEHAPPGPFRLKLAITGFIIGLAVRAGYHGILIALGTKFPIVKTILDASDAGAQPGQAPPSQPNPTGGNENMKKLSALILTAATLGFCLVAQAQTVTNVENLGPIGGFLANNLGVLDPTATNFNNESFEVRIGTITDNSGSGFAAGLGASINLSDLFSVEGQFDNANVGGTLLDAMAGIGINKHLGNFKGTGFIIGGYNFNARAAQGFAGVRLSVIPAPRSAPHLGAYIADALGVSGKQAADKLSTPDNRIEVGVLWSF